MDLSKHELQEAWFLYGRNFRTYLGLSETKFHELIKEKGILSPSDYVSSMSAEDIMVWVRSLGSFKRAASHFNVSMRFMLNRFQSIEKKDLNLERGFFESEIKRLGSVELAARVWQCSVTSIHKFAEANKIELSQLVKFSKSGFQGAKGRKAELMFADMRGDNISIDYNAQHSAPEHDFKDIFFGDVDVKSCVPSKYGSKKREEYKTYWKFNTANFSSDAAAFMAMDSKYERCRYIIIVHKSYIPKNQASITINEHVFKKFSSHEVTQISKDEWDKFVLKQDFFELLPPSLKRPRRRLNAKTITNTTDLVTWAAVPGYTLST